MLLSDEQYERIAPNLPGKPGDPGRTAADNRLFLEAVLWIVRTGAPWRDLPGIFGCWNTVFRRFRRWAKNGIFDKIFRSLSGDPDFEYALIDGTIVRVHRHGTGAKGTRHQAIGRSRGGLTTKIVALVDALGNLSRFMLLPGQRHDSIGVSPLIEDIAFEALLGDKAFDIDWIRPNWTEEAPPLSFRQSKTENAQSIATSICMPGAIWSKTSSAISKSFDASQPDTTRPIAASAP